MAGPGTGKSYAMKRRLMRLLGEGVTPGRILVVTFTRTAADLVKDIGGLGVEGCGDIRAGTLHSYCFGMLAKRHALAFTRRVPRPLVTYPDKGILQFGTSSATNAGTRQPDRPHRCPLPRRTGEVAQVPRGR